MASLCSTLSFQPSDVPPEPHHHTPKIIHQRKPEPSFYTLPHNQLGSCPCCRIPTVPSRNENRQILLVGHTGHRVWPRPLPSSPDSSQSILNGSVLSPQSPSWPFQARSQHAVSPPGLPLHPACLPRPHCGSGSGVCILSPISPVACTGCWRCWWTVWPWTWVTPLSPRLAEFREGHGYVWRKCCPEA